MSEIVTGAVGALLAAALVTAVLLRFLGGAGTDGVPVRRWAVPLALGLGYGAGHVALNGWPPARFDVELKHSLFWVAVLVTALGEVEACRAGRSYLLKLFGALASAWYLLDFMREHHWGPLEGWLWTLGLGGGLFALCTGLDALSRRGVGPSLPLALTVAGTCAGGALAASGSASLGQMCGAWTATTGVAWLVLRRRRDRSLPPGTALPLGILYGGLLLGGRYASELSPAGALLLAAAPIAPGLAALPPFARLTPRRAGWVALLLTLLVAGGALALELALRPDDPYAAYR